MKFKEIILFLYISMLTITSTSTITQNNNNNNCYYKTKNNICYGNDIKREYFLLEENYINLNHGK